MSARIDAVTTPPRPEVVLRVGITGHRKLNDAASVAATVKTVLARLREAAEAVAATYPTVFAVGGPRLIVVSALAEGADRIVAEAALAQDSELQVVVPFTADVYRNDFATDASRAKFDRLAAAAAAVFALDGTRADAPAAYELASRVMLANIDILIAVYDGKGSNGRGGTAETLAEAKATAIPAIVIDPAAPANPTLVWDEEMPLSVPGPLDSVVRDLIAPPRSIMETAAPPAGEQTAHAFEAPPTLPVYLRERQRQYYNGLAMTFPRLLAVLKIKPMTERDDGPGEYEAQVATEWASFHAACGESAPNVRAAVESSLRPAFAYADHLATFYSLLYRGAYIRSFLLAAVVVLVALIAVPLTPLLEAHTPDTWHLAGWAKVVLVAIELVLLLRLIRFVRRARYAGWHRKWLAYRELAELLRPMRMLAGVAADGPVPRPIRGAVDVKPQRDDPAVPASFTAWYAHAVRRTLPLPAAVADAVYLRSVVCAAADGATHGEEASEIEGQIGYNRRTAERMDNLEQTLHGLGLWLFWGSVVVCCVFLGLALFMLVAHVFHIGTLPDWVLDVAKPLTTFLTAGMPTVGAALLAIRVQGDFATVARRARRTAAHLTAIRSGLLDGPRTLPAVSARLSEAAAAMAADVEDWQRLSRTRPLQDP